MQVLPIRQFARRTGSNRGKSSETGDNKSNSASGGRPTIFDANKSKYSIENELKNQKHKEEVKEARKRSSGSRDSAK